MKKVSILIPTYNEEENVALMAESIVGQMEQLPQYDYELIFIDNDSKDSTRKIIREICSDNHKIKAIFNAKNYGQFSSPYYGILQATGDCVITMCCDFQDPVELIPKYLEEWENGYKIVLCQKVSSDENRIIYNLREFYYRFMKKHSEVEFLKQVTGSGLYDRSFVEVMRKIDDTRPFLRGIVAEMGFDIKLIPFNQPPRRAGKSSNTFYGYLDAASQSLTAYTKFGCRLALWSGLFATTASSIALIAFIIYWILNPGYGRAIQMLVSLAILLGVSLNMFFIGIVGEYVMDANQHTRKRPLVIESERINFDGDTQN